MNVQKAGYMIDVCCNAMNVCPLKHRKTVTDSCIRRENLGVKLEIYSATRLLTMLKLSEY